MVTRALTALSARRTELNKNEKGFTLIELLVVVIIIGILAAIAIPIFLGQQAQAKGSAVESAIANAKVQIVASVTSNGKFPEATDIATILTEAKGGDTKITLESDGGASGFCISGKHSEVNDGKDTWAADDKSGVVKGGTCTGGKLVRP